MGFSKFLTGAKQKVNRFLNTTLPSAARTGVRFLNSTLAGANKLHKVTKAITSEVSSNPDVREHIKKGAHTVNNFADAGLARLGSATESVNRVSKNLGLD